MGPRVWSSPLILPSGPPHRSSTLSPPWPFLPPCSVAPSFPRASLRGWPSPTTTAWQASQAPSAVSRPSPSLLHVLASLLPLPPSALMLSPLCRHSPPSPLFPSSFSLGKIPPEFSPALCPPSRCHRLCRAATDALAQLHGHVLLTVS